MVLKHANAVRVSRTSTQTSTRQFEPPTTICCAQKTNVRVSLRDRVGDLLAQPRNLAPQHVHERLAALKELEVCLEIVDLFALLVVRVRQLCDALHKLFDVTHRDGGRAVGAAGGRGHDLLKSLHLLVEHHGLRVGKIQKTIIWMDV